MFASDSYCRDMKKYSHTAVITAVAAALLIMLACTGQDKPEGPVTLEWWQFWTDPAVKPVIEEMVTEYEAAHPGITVNLTDLTWANGHEKIVVAFSSGTAPDIVELGSDWIGEFAAAGQLAPLNDMIEDTARLVGWKPAVYNDTIYACPWILGTRVLFINRSLMEQAGLTDLDIPVNWDKFREVCYKIDSIGDDIYGFGSNAAEKHRLYKKFLPFFWSAGGNLFSEDFKYVTIAGNIGYKALMLYKELSDSCSMIDTQRRLEDAFLAGKIGIIISGDWLLRRIKNEKPGLDFVTTLMPGPVYPGSSFMGGEYLAISGSCPYPGEAMAFIEYIINAENQIRFAKANYSASPSNKEAARDEFFKEDINLQTFIKQINISKMPPAIPEWVYIENIIEEKLEQVLFEDAPPAQSLYDAKLEIEKLIHDK